MDAVACAVFTIEASELQATQQLVCKKTVTRLTGLLLALFELAWPAKTYAIIGSPVCAAASTTALGVEPKLKVSLRNVNHIAR
jgi:hypothetical protein